MAAARLIPSKNHVLAAEHIPPMFRPSNQVRLQPAQATNPALHASTSFMPSFLDYQGANQWGDMGLGQRVVKSGNRDLGPKPLMLTAPAPTALPTSNAAPVPTSNAQPATVPAIVPASVSGLGAVSVSRGAPMPGMGSISRGAPMPGMGALSATNPFVLGALGLGVVGVVFLLLRKKKRG